MNFKLRSLLPIFAGAVMYFGSVTSVAAQDVTPTPGASAPPQVIIDAIVVRGAERLEASSVQVVTTLQTGRPVTPPEIQEAIRRLMSSGNFESVEIYSADDPDQGLTLYIDVVERPMIAGYDIDGLERVSAGTVRDTVGLRPNQPYNPQIVVRTERMIRDLLASEGVQLEQIDTVWTAVEDAPGTYRIAFDVREGNRLAIAQVQFEGNQAFDDDALRGAIATKSEGFFWFQEGRYDRERLEQDLLGNLPSFYGSNGYIDFNVVSDTLLVDPQSGKARLVIEVDEGSQYRLGEFAIQGARRFPSDELEAMFTARRRSVLGLPFGGSAEREMGEVFDRAALDAATERVRQRYRNQGYLYAQVEPIIERVESASGQPVVNVTWAISESSPFYVNRISIEGNTFTHESVIRDRLVVFPGDVYSEDRLLQSYRSIAALGFFETPMPVPDVLPNPQEGTVDLVFRVEERQVGSIGFGTSIGGGGFGRSGGVSGFVNYSHPNLFGQAKSASIQAEYGYGRSSFTASYTDPALFGTRNSGSVSLFHTDDRYRGFSFSEGRYVRTGVSLQYGFPLLNYRFTRAFAGYSLSRVNYEARDTDNCAAGDLFCQPTSLGSAVSLAVTRDTKDHPLFPRSGTRQNLTIQQNGGPLGGDGNFQKLTGGTEWWIPVGSFGGGTPGSQPIVLTFGLQAKAGAVFGDAERFPLERFFLGGTQFGQALRGYEESTITPFGYFDRNDTRISSSQRLGDAFLVITGEYALRLNDNISVSVFGDAGNVWNDVERIDPSQLFRSLGLGATVVTPFGPLGLDYAYGFDRLDPGWKFHFKINQPGF